MLCSVFSIILKMSCMTSVIAILLLSVKYIFQRIGFPRKIMILLWSVIAFRFLCPIAISSDISLFNTLSALNNTYHASFQQTENMVDTDAVIRYEILPNEIPDVSKPADRIETMKWISAVVWLAGMCAMLLFGAVSYLLLKKRLRFAVKRKDNIYVENIPTSFVFGIFRPKIFIPDHIPEQDLEYIILHEKIHLKRADHITKLAAYLILSLHWFNPLCWVMFKLFSDDIELACDETVLQKIGIEHKKQYLHTLLDNSVNKPKTILLYHVCFSANLTKRRVKSMIKLKKHSKLIAISAIIICVFSVMVFGTNATEQKKRDIPPVVNESDMISEAAPENTIAEPYTTQELPAKTERTDYKPPQKTTAPMDTSNNAVPIKEENSAKPFMQENKVESTPGITEAEPDKSFEKTAADCIDFRQNVFEGGTQIANVEQMLNNKGIMQTKDQNVQLGENYVLNEYSYENNCNATSFNISCDSDGTISLYFDVNTENLVDVTFSDSETKEVVAKFGILANDVNSYSFTGFSEDKTYDVSVQGKTEGTWKVEGQYIIY